MKKYSATVFLNGKNKGKTRKFNDFDDAKKWLEDQLGWDATLDWADSYLYMGRNGDSQGQIEHSWEYLLSSGHHDHPCLYDEIENPTQ